MLYLAFLNSWDQPFDPVAHRQNAYFCLSAELIEAEDGDIITPTFSVTIQNPGAGWLASHPTRFAVLSHMDEERGETEPVQIARGRLSTTPSELVGRDCQLEFTCAQNMELQVLKAAANLLRVGEVDYYPDAPEANREAAERYDPLFFPPGLEAIEDPLNVLAGTMEVWRWNRLTLIPERVHIIDGLQQHVIAGHTAGDAGSERMSVINPPRATTHLRLVANWTQTANADQENEFMATTYVDTYNYRSFLDSMPQPGTAIGTSTGWTIADAKIKDEIDLLPQTFGRQFASIWGATAQTVTMQAKRLTVGMRAHYDYAQDREEILDLYMSVGVQQIVQTDKIETIDQIHLASPTLDNSTPEWRYEHPDTLVRYHYNVGDKVQANGKVWTCTFEHDATQQFSAWVFDPITGDPVERLWIKNRITRSAINHLSPRLFDSPRGVRAVRHGLRRLQRIVQRRARAVEVSFEVPFWVGRMITCQDECRVESHYFPGGEVVGKVIRVQLKIDGASKSAVVTCGVSVGLGVDPTPSEGIEQTSGIFYGVKAPGVNEPVDVYALPGKPPRVLRIDNPVDVQNGFANAASLAGSDPVKAIADNSTILRVYFEPLRQEDLLSRRITAQTLPIYVRKGINLTPEEP